MYILFWIIFGAIVGWVASMITGDNARMGLIGNVLVGLIGSFIGGYIASLLNVASFTDFSLWGFVFAILGAVLLLWFIGLFRSRRHH